MARRKSLLSGQGGLPGIRVVALGGGTGLSTILKGLKRYYSGHDHLRDSSPRRSIADMAAVVTVTDDGGSSGRLRKDFNMLPPGDIRNCIVALSEDEPLLSRLFQYRFTAGAGLEGHSFGNLFVAALTAVTGDFSEAVRFSSAVLNTRGHIFPSTTSDVQLEAVMDDGSHVRGETSITASPRRVVDLRLVPGDARPLPEVLQAIGQADLITIGPGSLFTSLVPNLLVKGIPEAIARSRARKVFICNLMTQANESLGMSVADHIRAIFEHAGQKIFDYALINTRQVSTATRANYAKENAAPIVFDRAKVDALGVKAILGNFLEEAGVARHATNRVAEALFNLMSRPAQRPSRRSARALRRGRNRHKSRRPR
jgi:uncharacterized cofD-like protein